MSRLYCNSFPGNPGCCPSCHDDFEMGESDMMYLYVDGEDVGHVCCDVYRWIEETGIGHWLGLDR